MNREKMRIKETAHFKISSNYWNRQKEYNRQLAKHRIYVEHVIRAIKIFRILAQPYRNRRRRERIKL